MAVVLTAATAATLRRLAEDAYPEEGCGVLLGSAGGGGVTVGEVSSGRNIARARPHDRYELDPGAILAAERRARAVGLEVVGFWHSHPDHPARPSHLDSERAWPDYAYLICSVQKGTAADLRAYALAPDGILQERPLETGASAPAA